MISSAVPLAVSSDPPQPSVEDALQRWEAMRQPGHHDEMVAYARTVEDVASRGDAAVIGRLIGINRNRAQPMLSRAQALRVACALADSAGATIIVSALQSDLALPLRPQQSDTKEETMVKFMHEADLMQNCFETFAASLLGKLPDDQMILSFAVEAYFRRSPLPKTRNAAVELILKCQVSQGVLDSKIVEMAERSRAELPEALVDRMSSAALVPLREVLSASRTAGDLNYGVAGALAYLGDEETKAVLVAMLPSAREHSKSAEAGLLKDIWRIEVQHPPEKLLVYLSSTEFCGFRDSQSWAVSRAYKLGVDPSRIREAILTNASHAADQRSRLEVARMKQAGLDLGILRPDDLPDVPLPKDIAVP